jgi:hypothetical protein
MTAAEHLSPQQFPEYHPAIGHGEQLPMFMTPHEIGGMLSADFGGHMRDVPERMRSSYEHQQDKERLRGFDPGQHRLDRLSDQIQEQGGIHTPARIMHLPSGVASLYDGHHRSVVALEQNRLVPVEHFFDHKTVMAAIKRGN